MNPQKYFFPPTKSWDLINPGDKKCDDGLFLFLTRSEEERREGASAVCNVPQWWRSARDSSRLAPQPSLGNSPLECSCSENAAPSASVTRAAQPLLRNSWQLTMKSSRFPFRSLPGSRGIVFLPWFSTWVSPFVHDQ